MGTLLMILLLNDGRLATVEHTYYDMRECRVAEEYNYKQYEKAGHKVLYHACAHTI